MMLISLGDHKFYSMLDQIQLRNIFSPYAYNRYQPTILSRLNGKSIVLLSIGAFNPCHYFHLRMLERARDYIEKTLGQRVLEGVISPISKAFGQSNLVANEHRIQMLELATRSSDWIRVSNWQSQQKMPQNYAKVLRHLYEEYTYKLGPNYAQVMLVCGSDVLESLAFPESYVDPQLAMTKAEFESLLANYGLIVLSKPNTEPFKTIYSSDLLRKYEKNIWILDDETSLSSLSSESLRTAIRRNESIRYCINDPVLDYIYRNNLYRSNPKRPTELIKTRESVESVSLDELLEISSKWSEYFNSQIESGFVDNSSTRRVNQMNLSCPAVFSSHSPSPRSNKAVHFNLNSSRNSSASEPLPRRAIRLKFRQFNLSGTPETSL